MLVSLPGKVCAEGVNHDGMVKTIDDPQRRMGVDRELIAMVPRRW